MRTNRKISPGTIPAPLTGTDYIARTATAASSPDGSTDKPACGRGGRRELGMGVVAVLGLTTMIVFPDDLYGNELERHSFNHNNGTETFTTDVTPPRPESQGRFGPVSPATAFFELPITTENSTFPRDAPIWIGQRNTAKDCGGPIFHTTPACGEFPPQPQHSFNHNRGDGVTFERVQRAPFVPNRKQEGTKGLGPWVLADYGRGPTA